MCQGTGGGARAASVHSRGARGGERRLAVAGKPRANGFLSWSATCLPPAVFSMGGGGGRCLTVMAGKARMKDGSACKERGGGRLIFCIFWRPLPNILRARTSGGTRVMVLDRTVVAHIQNLSCPRRREGKCWVVQGTVEEEGLSVSSLEKN